MLLAKARLRSSSSNRLAKELARLEHDADTICHHINREAESTFITPLDREDLHALAKNLDNILDLIEDVASKIVIYNGLSQSTTYFHKFTNVIQEATSVVDALVGLLRFRDKHVAKMKKAIVAIHTLEHRGDELIRLALRELFRKQRSAVAVIKWKDLYETLEEVLDECEGVADVVEEIMIKNF